VAIERTFAGIPLGFKADGTLFYERRETQTEALIARFDTLSLAVQTPVPISERAVGRNREPQLSPDGREVAFLRAAPPTLVIRTFETGAERDLIQFRPPYGAQPVQWFPDGRSLLIVDREGLQKRFRRIDAQTGEAQTVFDAPWAVWTAALSRDGSFLFYSIRDEDGTLRLVRRHLDTGEESVLYRTPFRESGTGLFGLSVSPDGSRIAFAPNVDNEGSARLLLIVPSSGGVPREVLRSDKLFAQGAFGWTPDGKHLVFSVQLPQTPQQLQAISIETGEIRPLGITMQEISSRMVSGDGRRIVFTGSTGSIEVRALRNILQPPAR
jgi:Tol biopolymer transport system component